MLHTAARLRFVEENGLAHSDFDFARYLACRLGHALGELVEVPAQTWILLEVVLLCFWQADVHLQSNMRLFLWLLTGYATCIATYAIHAKLRLILHDYCAPFVEADVDMMHRLGAAAERDLGGHERFPTSPRTPVKEESDEEAPSTIAAQGNERTKMLKALKGESTRSLVDVLPTMRRRGPEAIPLRPVTETTHNYMEQFWYVQHPGPHFTFDMIRLSTLMTAIYIVIFALVLTQSRNMNLNLTWSRRWRRRDAASPRRRRRGRQRVYASRARAAMVSRRRPCHTGVPR